MSPAVIGRRFGFFVATFAVAFVLFSCATLGGTGKKVNMLPLADGWYQYDFTRTFRGVEDEQTYAVNYGVQYFQEITYRYSGVVVSVDGGFLLDPIMEVELYVDADGQISSQENMSIMGSVNKDGTFQWSGLTEEHGRLNSVFVSGALTFLPDSLRGGPEFDGVFHMEDPTTGKQILARISDGFFTWSYMDGGEAGFTPWPTLIRPDGSFSGGLDMTTMLEMVGISRQDFTTGFSIEGQVIPGQGISMEEISITAGMETQKAPEPQVFSGTTIRSGQFPNEAIPDNIETMVSEGRSEVRAQPRPNRENYPRWYLSPPRKKGFISAVGEKTFAVRETALTMAEAAAAATLANQIRLQIVNETIDVSGNAGTMTDDRIRTQALERLRYNVVEQFYNQETQTAFVLLEMRLE